MTCVFLQARLDSSRLPGKALLPLGGITVLQHAMRALKPLPVDRFLLLSTKDSESALAPLAEQEGYGLFLGPKEDVLQRFFLAAGQEGAQMIIRATGDNPLVSGPMAAKALELHRQTGSDYTGYTGLPCGAGVEVFRAESLETAQKKARGSYNREHVTPFLYRNPGRFKVQVSRAPQKYFYPQGRITLDTSQDYRFLQNLFDNLYQGKPLELEEIIPWLQSQEEKTG